ncbi:MULTISPECIES: lipid-binding SYLF domain-containing protein [Dyadobacter]|uniref:Lipid-binding SYLF domain-containing protein n=1 Tax=Dyadobacter chenhuakuii TaxID=2909339 RepID=A0A9X1TSW6_9BACT|nr:MULTISPECIES: lipid-binding SYLF domain-containing protein [Dyadobacter]MCF2493374.1 lipid-binding SYLF domain-containing protein [Dyadobacter chenhuakuii]MCF2497738.1 lipid-binding SYLF domain-containing protein [Dyadobacter chenhuakuii]MCF2517243.1 lipid-binding SYLF domain-containing protein [Dyadobacter sp. CY351]USJ32349.1 lipid-binding SYLF domain-containing protein [Dyadobacter chenhuakuii]
MITKNFKLLSVLALVFTLSGSISSVQAQGKEEDKIRAAVTVLDDFSSMEESIPAQLLDISKGIIIVPKLINAGLMVGGKHGKGIAMVKNAKGEWSDPVFVTITGGSVGAQIGVQAVDLVLIFKNSKTLTEIGKGSFTLGGDLSVAAGPMGRSSSASTDYKLEAEVYSYSRSKGLFAGVTINGAALSVDAKANNAFYGNTDSANTIFTSSRISSKPVADLKDKLDDLN